MGHLVERVRPLVEANEALEAWSQDVSCGACSCRSLAGDRLDDPVLHARLAASIPLVTVTLPSASAGRSSSSSTPIVRGS